MTEAHIVPALPEHVALFAPLIRAADVAEIWAAAHATPEQALQRGLEAPAWAGFIDDAPVCLFGVSAASLLSGIGVPWMLGTDLVEKHQVTFLRRCRPIVRGWQREYRVLANFVDDRNTVAHRWLRWLGFSLGDPQPYGPDGLPFRAFTWEKSGV